MAYWHLDDKAQAKQWHDKSLAWQTANQPAATADKELQTCHTAAAITPNRSLPRRHTFPRFGRPN